MSATQDQAGIQFESRSIEREWINWLRTLPDPLPALRTFTRHYHYFSLNQVVAFSRLLAALTPTDRESMTVLAQVLFEELGEGKLQSVHSILFERFSKSVGIAGVELPLSPSQVLNGVRWYVCELELAFGGSSLPRALATYCFLESSAVATYPPLLEALRAQGFSEGDLEFFVRHATIEVEHAATANRLVERANLSGEQGIAFDDQLRLLEKCWRAFWEDISKACQQAYT